jgi:hypothetical protein
MLPSLANELALRLALVSAVQNMTDNRFSLSRQFAQHTTVGIEALRCTGGAGETTNTAWD